MVQAVNVGEIEKVPKRRDVDPEHPFGRPPENLPKLSAPCPTRAIGAIGATGATTAPDGAREREVSAIRLEVIDLGRASDRTRFIDVVYPIYAGDPNFVAPLRFERKHFLNPKRNPSFENLDVRAVIAHQNGKVVGRITAHIDRAYNKYHAANVGWFGFFECVPDRRVAHALLDDAVRWLREKGATEVVGPCNFNTNHTVGCLVENFDRPAFIEMTYNPRYYEDLITSYGFGKAKDLLVWWIDIRRGLDNPKVQRIARIADRVRQRERVTIRGVNLDDFNGEVERLFALYNSAWQKNWGFVPLTRREFREIASQLRQIVVPELVIFVEVDGKPVAFSCALPNVTEAMPKDGKLFPLGWLKLARGLKKVKHARLFTLGVIPEYRKQGLETLLFLETVTRSNALGYHSGEIGWTLEDNDLINRPIEAMDGKLDRRYRLFGLDLT